MEIGYDSFNPILNLGTLFVLVLFYIIQVILFFTLLWPLKVLKYISSKTFWAVRNMLFWRQIWLIIIEGYIEFVISVRLFYEAPVASVDNTPLQISMAWILFVICYVGMPVIYTWLVTVPIKTLGKSKTFRRRWLSLYDELNLKDQGNLIFNV